MAGATRRRTDDIDRALRGRGGTPEGARGRFPYVLPRVLNVAWASIAPGDLIPGELVFNDADDSLVIREGSNIYRYDKVATRTI